MQNHNLKRPIGLRHNSGMATLEFVMALPILLLLMVGITWLGFYVIGQTEVIIEARNKAWKKRFVNEKQVPLMFPTGIGDATNPKYPGDDDYVIEEATTTVDVSPIFAMVPGPKSSHTILAGSWDHSAMKFEEPPEWTLVGYALLSEVTGELQTLATDLGNLDQLISDLVGQAAAAAASKIAGGGGGGGSTFENIDSDVPKSEPDENKRPTDGEEDQRETALKADRERLKNEKTQVDADLERLGDFKTGEPKEKTQERQYLQIKKHRIENHLNYLDKEIGD